MPSVPKPDRLALPRWQTLALAVLGLPHVLLLLLVFAGRAPVSAYWEALLASLGLLLAGALLLSLLHLQRLRGQLAGARLAATLPPPEVDLLRSQLQAADTRLHEVLDALPAGVAVYDNQDRLLIFNREMAQQQPYLGDGKRLGETYEALLRRALDETAIPDALGREEEWLALRLAGRRHAGAGTLTRCTEDSPGMHAFEQRTPSGYTVTSRLDAAALAALGQAPERAHEHVLRLSLTDGLTGIANRRQFEQAVQAEWQRCARSQGALSVLLVDIDQFRHYNKHYGHQTGDECLRQVARILALCVKRSGELVARYDGAAFAILLPGASTAEARHVAQRCLLDFLSARIPHEASTVAPWLSVSVGAATLRAERGQDPARLLSEADAALRQAKSGGGARLEAASEAADARSRAADAPVIRRAAPRMTAPPSGGQPQAGLGAMTFAGPPQE